jgi:hypothetical protein
VRQRPGKTLHKFIQWFSQVRNKIPRITDAEIISAFSAGVTDMRMREKLGVNDTLDSTVKLFELADKCAKAEEGRMFSHNVPDVETDAALSKNKSGSKCKPPAILAAEPEQKNHRGSGSASGKHDKRPFYVFHNMHSHSTEDCYELKKLSEEHKKRWSGEGAISGGGRGGHRGNKHPRQAHANAAQHPDDNNNALDEGEDAGGFQEPRRVACIFGGAQAPRLNRHFKQLHREVNAALPGVETAEPLKWS